LKSADEAEATAAKREGDAAAAKQRADDLKANAEKNAKALEDRQATAKAKQEALLEAKQRAAAQGPEDAKAKAKLDKSAAAADKAATDAKQKAANAQKRADGARVKSDEATEKRAKAEARSQKARADANAARAQQKKAEAKAEKARQKAEALKPKDDPETSFADLNEPGDALPGPIYTSPTTDTVVWVRTAKGPKRWTYVEEGSKGFGKGGSSKGTYMQKTEADERGFRPDNTEPAPAPISQRTNADGRVVESAGAGGSRGSRVASATAEAESAVKVTSIPPDISENQVYGAHLDAGELGVLRPQGSNLKGVDSITAKMDFDTQGRPVRGSTKIYLNDATTPTAEKGAKAAYVDWAGELKAALDPNAPPGRRLDFGDPRVEAAIRKAAEDGEIYVRIVRTETTPTGRSTTMDPGETVRLGPIVVPKLPNVAEVREDEKDEEKAP